MSGSGESVGELASELESCLATIRHGESIGVDLGFDGLQLLKGMEDRIRAFVALKVAEWRKDPARERAYRAFDMDDSMDPATGEIFRKGIPIDMP